MDMHSLLVVLMHTGNSMCSSKSMYTAHKRFGLAIAQDLFDDLLLLNCTDKLCRQHVFLVSGHHALEGMHSVREALVYKKVLPLFSSIHAKGTSK